MGREPQTIVKHFNVLVAFVAALEMLDDGLRLAAHVSVGGRLLIDGVAQFQTRCV